MSMSLIAHSKPESINDRPYISKACPLRKNNRDLKGTTTAAFYKRKQEMLTKHASRSKY
jgi:hypothetical protein